ncbi:MAG: hypothetical protein N2235_08995 [Fischerella sp.]|nr:hypothetical protein [Fischerella sp.]
MDRKFATFDTLRSRFWKSPLCKGDLVKIYLNLQNLNYRAKLATFIYLGKKQETWKWASVPAQKMLSAVPPIHQIRPTA